MSEWKEYILEDVIDKFVDYRGKTPNKTASGIPLITAKIIKEGRILEPNEFIAEEDYESWMTRGYPEINDVVMTTEAPLGLVALIKNERVALAQRIITLKTKKKVCDSIFLKYYLESVEGQSALQTRASGSTVEGIKAAELKKMEISLPEIDEQYAIASILSSLDDKVDLLHRQNKTLEQLAETLFRQWFVEEADESWEVGKLGDVIEIFDSKRVPLSSLEREKMKFGKLYPYYGAATILDYINDYIFEGEYILMGEDGTVETEDGFPILQMPIGKFWVNNHTHIFQAKDPFTNYFIYTFLKGTNISNIITGAVQPKINQEMLKSIDFPIPPIKKIELYISITSNHWNKIKINNTHIHTLTQMRDTLLPKLMSGEIRLNCDSYD